MRSMIALERGCLLAEESQNAMARWGGKGIYNIISPVWALEGSIVVIGPPEIFIQLPIIFSLSTHQPLIGLFPSEAGKLTFFHFKGEKIRHRKTRIVSYNTIIA